jgi:DUF1680 family protein
MWSWRMHGIAGLNAKYFDTIETILYNHCLGALSPDHTANFYYNPLKRVGSLAGKTDHGGDPVRRTRLPDIHSTTCCLPNAWRFFAQLPEYVFSSNRDGVLVNLFTNAQAWHELTNENSLSLQMETAYPHDGQVTLRVHPQQPAQFTLWVRIPAWCAGASIAVNDDAPTLVSSGAYAPLSRAWRPGDTVRLKLPMRPVVLTSRLEILANRGQVALRRGPLIYCLEQQDAPDLDLERAVIVLDGERTSSCIQANWNGALGCHVLKARIGQRCTPASQPAAYFPMPPTLESVREVQLIPFYQRANRAGHTRWLTWIPYQ